LHPQTTALMETIARRVEEAGIDAWFDLEVRDLLGEEAAQYEKVTDILDVWFDSGVSHACVLARLEQLALPADLYLEGSDQHRGWFQSSLLTSVAMHQAPPYKAVLTHGFTVDAAGHKMSKSLGNVIAPQKVVNTLGADIVRLWVAATDYRGEMNVSDEILRRMADAYRRIRNTARFLLANLNGFDPAVHLLAPEEMLALDQWIVARTGRLQAEIRQAYEDYEFHLIYQQVHNFCALTLGSFYLDIIKDRQYTTRSDGVPRRSAQTALYHVVEALVRWIAPVLSFTAEDIWRHMPGQRGASVFLEEWYTPVADWPQDGGAWGMDNASWEQVIVVREAVSRELEKLRVAGAIGSSLDAEVDLYCSEQLYDVLAQLQDELRFVLITSYARIYPLTDKPNDAAVAELDGDEHLWVKAVRSEHGKCVRCWHHREDVGQYPEHPALCGRCVANVSGQGEVRQFA